MIPIKLVVRNFMCYRDNVPPLSFEGIHIACLCGDNGNGKSALLDAMTWALWGKARARSDDDLIHLGQTEMNVELEFDAGQKRHRVIRKRSKARPGRAGQTTLELQVAGEDGFRPITGNSVAETQAKIVSILHLDYETFINSAFLLQGHADEFTIKQPRKRKEVLTKILGLSRYDELEERAKNHAREGEGRSQGLSADIADIDQELGRRGEYEVELAEEQISLAQLEEEIKGKEGLIRTLRQQSESLEHKREQLIEIERLIKETGEELGYWKKQAEEHHGRIAGYEEVLTQRTAIKEGYEQFLAAKTANEELNEKLRPLLEMRERKAQLEKAIERAKAELLTEQGIIASQIERGEARIKRLPQLEEGMRQAEARLYELTKEEEGLGERRQRSQELLTQTHHLESANSALKTEIKDIEDKLALLTGGDARCPLCETELGVEGRHRIEEKYKADHRARADRYQSNQKEMDQKRLEQWSLESEIAQLEAGISKARIAEESRMGLLKKDISDAEQASQELAEGRTKLAQLESRLAKKDFASTEQGTLQQLEGETAALGYDVERHRELRQQIEGLKGFEALERRLGEAESLVAQERESLARAEEAAVRLRSRMEADSKRREGLAAEMGALPALREELREAEQGYQVRRQQQTELRQRLWTIEERLRRCAEMERTREEKKQRLQRSSEEEGIYRELAEAFGKRGIQALLIETALPEIEVEANRLLSRMTDNRMHVKIETQREAKKGGTIETLDINIADELGTRNYEMFSGGETFRIDFALRIALSKLLARRAGAPLPTLVIDEGFGTQDSTGRARLVEAISSIQDDFQKILVITHIEELKDEFEVRIDVTKTAEGSMISVG
jgi:exonuclease SbcC